MGATRASSRPTSTTPVGQPLEREVDQMDRCLLGLLVEALEREPREARMRRELG
jgi:hypothetical protein